MTTKKKNYGTGSYNPDDITQIILRLQDKEAMKKQKQELLAMDLDPKLAEEIFGNKYGKKGKYGKKSSKSKYSSKTSGFHSGDIIVYRDKILCQILDKLDEYLQISWPITKPLYQRAILWANIDRCAKRKKEKKKRNKKKEKERENKNFEDKFTAKENKKSSSIFSGIFGKSSLNLMIFLIINININLKNYGKI